MDWQVYPTTPEELARALVADAERELEDARVLYAGNRWAATVTSALHSMEKAFKALLVMARAVSEIPTTHRMLPIVEDRVGPFRTYLRADPVRVVLRREVLLLECWIPNTTHGQNYEYPWFDLLRGQLLLPRDEFQQAHADQAIAAVAQVLIVVRDFVQTEYGVTL
jgi:hypothetical protein